MPDQNAAASFFVSQQSPGTKRLRIPASPRRVFLARMKRKSWLGRKAAVRALKRGLDILGASSALLLLSPILLAVMAAICLESRGPALLTQIRVGRNGKRFKLHQFRSIYVDAEEKRQAQLARGNREGAYFRTSQDPRLTRVGRIIRRLSIDKLPQLWNVLNGTMSLVGPPPIIVSEVVLDMFYQPTPLTVRPGIISFGQVELEPYYMHQPPFRTDLKLMLKTVPPVIGGRGAYSGE
ncbi:MAG TPA: sugar transferase [Hyphomicrobiales bacterium]|nr:sugar transferase [Hyphomicrobiales bacterium]